MIDPSTTPARRVCLFAQYDPRGTIPAHTRHYLRHLAGCGLMLHVACAGVRDLAADDAGFLAAIGATAHPRPNRGLDFGAWQALLRAGCTAGAAHVLLANDSVFGPFAPLDPIIAAMDARGLDAWGMVASLERVPHLQSWFVMLSAEALARPALARLFAQDFAAMDKDEIILHGELGLSVAFRAEHLRIGAAWPAPRRGLARLIPVNPSHFDWRAMLQSGAVPFLKAELLRDNPANIAWLGGWRAVVAACPLGDPALIDLALGDARPPLAPAKPLRRILNVALTQDRGAALAALLQRSDTGHSRPRGVIGRSGETGS